MMSRTWKSVLVFAVWMLVAVGARGQGPALIRALPDAASPGDLVILEGLNLGSITAVRFTATVGGFVGVWNVNVTPTLVTATRVEAIVPLINSFSPPNATPPGLPAGQVRCMQGNIASNQVPFTFYEATFGVMQTAGQGSLQSTGQGRPVISLPILGNATVPPFPSTISIFLENAVPLSLAFLAISLPATPPYALLNGGTLVVTVPPPILFSNLPVDSSGQSAVSLPAAAGGPFNVTIALQWAVLDFGASNVALSNALLVQI